MGRTDIKRICFTNSPAFRWFGHLVPEDGLVPAKDVMVYWNGLSPERVRDVAVIYRPADLDGKKGHKLWDYNRAFTAPLRMSAGNCQRSWKPNDPNELWPETDYNYGCDPFRNPANLWHMLVTIGFTSEIEAKRALAEFARIRDCGWARDPAFVLPPIKPLSARELAELEGRTLCEDQSEPKPYSTIYHSFGKDGLEPHLTDHLPQPDDQPFRRINDFMVPVEVWRQGAVAISEWMEANCWKESAP